MTRQTANGLAACLFLSSFAAFAPIRFGPEPVRVRALGDLGIRFALL